MKKRSDRKEEEDTKRAHKMRVNSVGGEGGKRADFGKLAVIKSISLMDLQVKSLVKKSFWPYL